MSRRQKERDKRHRRRAAERTRAATATPARRGAAAPGPRPGRSGGSRAADKRSSRVSGKPARVPRRAPRTPLPGQEGPLRFVLAAGFILPACFVVYLLASGVAIAGAASGSFLAIVLYVWYVCVAGFAGLSALALLQKRRRSPSFWGLGAGVPAGAAILFALGLYAELVDGEGSAAAVATLAGGLAAFAIIGGLAGLQLWLTIRDANRVLHGDTRRPSTEAQGSSPGRPLYR